MATDVIEPPPGFSLDKSPAPTPPAGFKLDAPAAAPTPPPGFQLDSTPAPAPPAGFKLDAPTPGPTSADVVRPQSTNVRQEPTHVQIPSEITGVGSDLARAGTGIIAGTGAAGAGLGERIGSTPYSDEEAQAINTGTDPGFGLNVVGSTPQRQAEHAAKFQAIEKPLIEKEQQAYGQMETPGLAPVLRAVAPMVPLVAETALSGPAAPLVVGAMGAGKMQAENEYALRQANPAMTPLQAQQQSTNPAGVGGIAQGAATMIPGAAGRAFQRGAGPAAVSVATMAGFSGADALNKYLLTGEKPDSNLLKDSITSGLLFHYVGELLAKPFKGKEPPGQILEAARQARTPEEAIAVVDQAKAAVANLQPSNVPADAAPIKPAIQAANRAAVIPRAVEGATPQVSPSEPAPAVETPLTVWHGSRAEPGKFSGASSAHLGDWFASDNPEYAKDYGTPSQYELSLRNPYQMPVDEFRKFDRGGSDSERVKAAKERRQELQGQGYDGIVVRHPDGTNEYIAFDKSQAKPIKNPPLPPQVPQQQYTGEQLRDALPKPPDTIPPVPEPQGAGRTPPPEQAPQRPGGKATVLYHSTQSAEDFSAFKPKSYGTAGEHSYFYFSDKRNALQRMIDAGASKDVSPPTRVISAQVDVRKPFDLTDASSLTPGDFRNRLESSGVKISEELRRRLDAAPQGATIAPWQFFRFDTPTTGDLRKSLIDAGYDGVKWNEHGGITTAALHPEQITVKRSKSFNQPAPAQSGGTPAPVTDNIDQPASGPAKHIVVSLKPVGFEVRNQQTGEKVMTTGSYKGARAKAAELNQASGAVKAREPSTDGITAKRDELMKQLKTQLIQEHGPNIGDQQNLADKANKHNQPHLLLSDPKAMELGNDLPEDHPARITMHNLAELEKNPRGTKFVTANTNDLEAGSRVQVNKNETLTYEPEEGVIKDGITVPIPEGGTTLVGTKILPPAFAETSDTHFSADEVHEHIERAGGKPEEAAPAVNKLVAFHGSPHDFDKFDSSKIGTGEGAQAFGHGLYFASRKDVAAHYQEKLSERTYAYKGKDIPAYGQWYSDNPELYAAQRLASRIEHSNDDFGTVHYKETENLKADVSRAKNLLQSLKDDFMSNRVYDPTPERGDVPKPTQGEIKEQAQTVEKLEKALEVMRGIKESDLVAKKTGSLYQTELAPREDELLNWEKPLSEQSQHVQKALEPALLGPGRQVDVGPDTTGEALYKLLQLPLHQTGKGHLDAQAVSDYLHSLGIRGIKYLDNASRSQGEGARNYVIFDDKDVTITHKNDQPVGGSNAAEKGNQSSDLQGEPRPALQGGPAQPTGAQDRNAAAGNVGEGAAPEERRAANAEKVARIQDAISRGKRIEVRTQMRITPLTDPSHIKVAKNGDVYTRERSKWVFLFGHQVDALVDQAGPKVEAATPEAKPAAPAPAPGASEPEVVKLVRQRTRLQARLNAIPDGDTAEGTAAHKRWAELAKPLQDQISALSEKIGERPPMFDVGKNSARLTALGKKSKAVTMGEVSPEESARIAAERANQPFKLSSGEDQQTMGDLLRKEMGIPPVSDSDIPPRPPTKGEANLDEPLLSPEEKSALNAPMEEEKPALARPHQEEFDKLKPILEKQVGSEVTPRRKAMAANEVMAGTPPEVAAELIRHLGTIAPDAIEHMRGEKALRPAWAKKVLDEVAAHPTEEKSQNLKDIESGKLLADHLNQKIDEWVKMGTRNGVLDTAWERKAVKRLVDAEFGTLTSGSSGGKMAGAKIAVSKATTFEGLRRAVSKISPAESPGSTFRANLRDPSPEAISDAAAWLKANGGAKDKTEATRKLVSEFGKPAMKHAAEVLKQMGGRPQRRGAVPLPALIEQSVKGVRDTARAVADSMNLNPVPKLERISPEAADAAVEHASARIAVPHMVDHLLSKVFPDTYHDPAAMTKPMEAIVKDNILAGFDDFAAKAKQAKIDGDDAAAKKFQAAADDIEAKHDLKQYDADVQAALADPKTKADIDRWKQHVNPYLDQLFNEMKAVDPNTPREGRGRHTDARINLLALDDEGLPINATFAVNDKGEPQKPLGQLSGRTRNPDVKKDRFDRAAKFTGNYSIDPQQVLTEAIGRRWNEVSKLRFINAIDKSGAGKLGEYGDPTPTSNGQRWIQQPVRVPQTDPTTGKTQMVEKPLFLQPSIVRETRAVLDTDLRPPMHPVAKIATAVQLTSPVDFVSHVRNLWTVAASQGSSGAWSDVLRRMPVLGHMDALVRVAKTISEVRSDSPAIREEIAGMAKQGLIRPEYPGTGITAITGSQQAIHRVDTATRVVMNRFFDNLVDRGLAKDTPENRRAYVLQAGQYNRRLMGRWTALAKDTGMSPFIVAGRTFNRLGKRSLFGTPGYEAASTSAAVKARALQLTGTIATLGIIPMMLNTVSTGKVMGRPGTPIGAWDTGKTDADGNPIIVDLAQITGMRRGMRSLGLNATIEGIRQGKDANTITGDAISEAAQTAMHPWVGPGAGFLYAAATGRRADLRGTMEARKIEEGGGKQLRENARAALESQNPLLYHGAKGILKSIGEQKLDTDSFLEGGDKSIGKTLRSALGVKSARPPRSAAEDLARNLSGSRFGEGVTVEDAKVMDEKRDILSRIAQDPKSKQTILSAAVKEGTISNRERQVLDKKSGMSYLRWTMRGLTLDQGMQVWDKASDAERKEIQTDLRVKLYNAARQYKLKAGEGAKYEKKLKDFHPASVGG